MRAILAGGDRRSIGRSDEVVDRVRAHPKSFAQLVECLWDSDPCVSMRAADAIEKLTRESAARLQKHKKELLGLMAETRQKEVRWHLAVILPRLELTPAECRYTEAILRAYLNDGSSIVKTFALQGLVDLTQQNLRLVAPVIELLREATRSGTAAMRARARILLRKLEPPR